MADDIRELAHARIFAILQDLDGLKSVTRNELMFAEGLRPAANLLDGAEVCVLPTDGSIISGTAPFILGMFPKISLLVGQKPGQLGPVVNAWRVSIRGAILGDAQLKSIIGAGNGGGSRANGRIVYRGLTPHYDAAAQVMSCDVEFDFAIYCRESGS